MKCTSENTPQDFQKLNVIPRDMFRVRIEVIGGEAVQFFELSLNLEHLSDEFVEHRNRAHLAMRPLLGQSMRRVKAASLMAAFTARYIS